AYTLHLADNALILGQRNSEWCGHGPVLEQDIAITNISLDLIGQARNFYQYAATLYNNFSAEEKKEVDHLLPRLWKTYDRELQEDDLAFLRGEHQYLNLLITELPKGDWAQTILRQFFFSAFQFYQYTQLQNSSDEQLAAIAEKSLKETSYHLRWSSEWVIRLGAGTEESNARIRNALNELWMFTGEMLIATSWELRAMREGYGINASIIKDDWMKKVQTVFQEATLPSASQDGEARPDDPFGRGQGVRWSQSGGKEGRHTEHLGYLLSEMQYLQRVYPNAIW
ncbi:MAG: phenylacetate-CoA oxygenase subunit PaaC, partial [Bacteroidota bacterium]|nr:phenylacetate-CoA oxygenase subunit PaaC [Bacteroidota bacterium]